MPWKEATAMSERSDFIEQAQHDGVNISGLCREYGISRTTGYKWLRRYIEAGPEGLNEQSRRPRHSPNKTPNEVESTILQVRSSHPSWGGVKILAYLKRQGWLDLPPNSYIAPQWTN